jgi:protein ImuB
MKAICCFAVPRFDLVAACRAEPGLLKLPSATANRVPGGHVVRELSATAEAAGVERGMSLPRAWGICPQLRIATSDPVGAEELWEHVVAELEGVGAEVDCVRPGEAFFAIEPLRQLYGGRFGDVIAVARKAVPLRVRAAVAPARFASFAAAVVPRAALPSGGKRIVTDQQVRGFLAPLDIASLVAGPCLEEKEAEMLVGILERLGIQTLGALATLSPDHMADRFGELGLVARRLARGEDAELRPRMVREEVVEEIDVGDGVAGVQLERNLEVLVERALASPHRKDRTVLAVRLTARLIQGGSWDVKQVLGSPTARPETISSLLLRHLEELPGPPSSLSLRLTAFGPKPADQLEFPAARGKSGRDRLTEAAQHVQTLEGIEALLDVIEMDVDSRVPDRWALLAPHRPDRAKKSQQ